jgi:hypothetical protein
MTLTTLEGYQFSATDSGALHVLVRVGRLRTANLVACGKELGYLDGIPGRWGLYGGIGLPLRLRFGEDGPPVGEHSQDIN